MAKPDPDRIINYNKWLYGPGPVRRRPKGFLTSYSRMPPGRGFALAAAQGLAIGLSGATCYKVFIGDPKLKTIEDYYKTYPPLF
jgi:hypothetical protein